MTPDLILIFRYLALKLSHFHSVLKFGKYSAISQYYNIVVITDGTVELCNNAHVH